MLTRIKFHISRFWARKGSKSDIFSTMSNPLIYSKSYSGSERIKYAAEEMAIHWSGENDERLCWFSSISAVGRRHYIAQLKSDKAIVEKVLQFSASKPIDQDFVEFGLRKNFSKISS